MTATRSLSASLQHLHRTLRADEFAGLSDAELVGRFVERRDEYAFAALVGRYGRVVFGVCRRVLRHTEDAEDAFQATFLIFARDAASVQRAGAIGNWLYGVAHNVARKAKGARARRAVKEREAVARPRLVAPAGAVNDWTEVLDRELDALPDKYRAPIVLCDLFGRTIQEAAVEVGCPPKTLGTRLSRARALLARRLTRRGLTLSPAALVAALGSDARVAAAVPNCLLDSAVHSAVDVVAGTAAATPAVVALTQGLSHMTIHSILKSVLLVGGLLVAGAFTTGPVLYAVHAVHTPRAAEPTAASAAVARSEPEPVRPAIDLDGLHRMLLSMLPFHAAESPTARTRDDKKDDKPQSLSGVWVKKDGQLKIEFASKTELKISPHGKDDQILILCEYSSEKDGRVKTKITGFEGEDKVKKAVAEKIPAGTEFGFTWKVTKDAATLDEVTGEKADFLKSHLEGTFDEKK